MEASYLYDETQRMMHKHVVIGDIITVVVSAWVLYNNVFVWAITGMHLAIRYATGQVNSACIAVSILQLSNTCVKRRAILPPGMTYAVSLLGMLLSFCARTPLFLSLIHI